MQADIEIHRAAKSLRPQLRSFRLVGSRSGLMCADSPSARGFEMIRRRQGLSYAGRPVPWVNWPFEVRWQAKNLVNELRQAEA